MKNSCTYISKTELNKLRHKAELPLLFVCVLVNFTVISLIIILMVYFDNFGIAYYIAFGYLVINLFLTFGGTLSVTRLNSVRVTVDQFPDVHIIMKKIAKALGIKKIPAVYVRQLDGEVSSFSSNFFFRNYVMISAEIFETKDLETISFFIAYEFAHIAYNHTKLWYNLCILVSRYIPFLYAALSRAMVFSCDNVAKKLCPYGIDGVFMLLAGNRLYKTIDRDTYLRQAVMTKGWFEFYANLKSPQPVLVRRIPALYNKVKQRIF